MSRTARNALETSSAYVAYYRVSTARQGESGLGLDAQRAAVARYLQGKSATIQAEFTEVESGKRHSNRPQLAAAIAECKRTGATLIIAKLDRLARNVHFISGLMESATNFIAVDMPHATRLTIHILAAIAEHEREMISVRTKAALEQCKARGIKLGNPHCREALVLARAVRHPGSLQAQVVTMMTERRAAGDSLRQIAGALNGLGIKTPSGAQWHANSVRLVLAAA